MLFFIFLNLAGAALYPADPADLNGFQAGIGTHAAGKISSRILPVPLPEPANGNDANYQLFASTCLR